MNARTRKLDASHISIALTFTLLTRTSSLIFYYILHFFFRFKVAPPWEFVTLIKFVFNCFFTYYNVKMVLCKNMVDKVTKNIYRNFNICKGRYCQFKNFSTNNINVSYFWSYSKLEGFILCLVQFHSEYSIKIEKFSTLAKIQLFVYKQRTRGYIVAGF